MLFSKKNNSKEPSYDDMQNLIPIENIVNGLVILKDNKKIIILKIEPTNFKLKSSMEQKAILEGYKLFLKRCNFNMQILIQTERKDLSEHLKSLKNLPYEDMFLHDMVTDYINFTKDIIYTKEVISRNFYIITEVKNNENEIISKIQDSLKLCDNEVKKCSTEEIVQILKNCMNKKIAC